MTSCARSRLVAGGLVFALCPLWSTASAQGLPGNGTLQGSYYFRYLGVDTSNANATVSALGMLVFDGNGKYKITGTKLVRAGSTDQPASLTGTGTYSLRSSSTLAMASPFSMQTLFGAFGAGSMVVASSTDSPLCDLFVAMPVSANSGNTALSGNYYVASLEMPNGDFSSLRNTFFSLTADGKGGLGNPLIAGTAVNLGNQPTAQTSSGATYSLGAAGNGTLTLPAPAGVAVGSQLLAGTKTLYASGDGSVFLAGNSSGYDMVIGVKALAGNSNTQPLSGAYFTGILMDDTTPNGFGLYASQGVSNEVPSTGVELAYERANSPTDGYYDYTYSDTFTFAANGTAAYSDSQFAAGASGNLVISAGYGGVYQLGVFIKAPSLSGSGAFLNPMEIVNAASFAPFEAQIAPGEFLLLNGSGLSSQTMTASALPLQTTLGGVQVTIDGTAMPIYSISPTAITAIVPYTAKSDGSLVTIQVNNNGTNSNGVQVYTGITSPGVFTLSSNGLGDGAVLHSNFNVVNTKSPAQRGEIVSIFLTGAGTAGAGAVAGAAAPANPLPILEHPVEVFIGGESAEVLYQGLAPSMTGLYQLNVRIPVNINPGSAVRLELSTVDAFNSQATIAVK